MNLIERASEILERGKNETDPLKFAIIYRDAYDLLPELIKLLKSKPINRNPYHNFIR